MVVSGRAALPVRLRAVGRTGTAGGTAAKKVIRDVDEVFAHVVLRGLRVSFLQGINNGGVVGVVARTPFGRRRGTVSV